MTSTENLDLNSLNLPYMVDLIIKENFEGLEIPSQNDKNLKRLIGIARSQINSIEFLAQFGLTPGIVQYDKDNPKYRENFHKLDEYRSLLQSYVTGRSVQAITEEKIEFNKLIKRRLY
jgi:hypothetical protein